MLKYVIMQELEESNAPNPYIIVNDEERAEELCYKLEAIYPNFIFWYQACEEEEK